jgi:preprotein translocase subunit YajC
MQWQVILAMVIAVPLILLPVAFVWYLNIRPLYSAMKESRRRKATVKKGEVRA